MNLTVNVPVSATSVILGRPGVHTTSPATLYSKFASVTVISVGVVSVVPLVCAVKVTVAGVMPSLYTCVAPVRSGVSVYASVPAFFTSRIPLCVVIA